MTDPARPSLTVPPELARNHEDFFGAAGTAWIAELPALARERMARWHLTPDGPAAHGVVALVLPVRRADGTAAVLKLQPVDEETAGEPVALRAWNGRGAVRLLDHDPASGSMLLERLDAARTLAGEPEDVALTVIGTLLSCLAAVPAPPGLRTLSGLAAGLLARTPAAIPRLADPGEARLLTACAAAVRTLSAEPGDRLLHWDLHYDNVLASTTDTGSGTGAGTGAGTETWTGAWTGAGENRPRGRNTPTTDSGPAPAPSGHGTEWVAIDPKPLAGDPGFDLFPALRNRWDAIAAAASPEAAVLRRFDLLTESAGLDRSRAAGWTLGRVLQNAVWDVEGGEVRLAADQATVGRAMLRRHRG